MHALRGIHPVERNARGIAAAAGDADAAPGAVHVGAEEQPGLDGHVRLDGKGSNVAHAREARHQGVVKPTGYGSPARSWMRLDHAWEVDFGHAGEMCVAVPEARQQVSNVDGRCVMKAFWQIILLSDVRDLLLRCRDTYYSIRYRWAAAWYEQLCINEDPVALGVRLSTRQPQDKNEPRRPRV